MACCQERRDAALELLRSSAETGVVLAERVRWVAGLGCCQLTHIE